MQEQMQQPAPGGAALQAAPQPAGGGASVAHEITHSPSFAMLRVDLQPGQTLIAEAGSMVAKNDQVAMEVKMNSSKKAGFFGKFMAFMIAMIRKVIGGETFFVNHFHTQQQGSVWIAPSLSGQVSHRRLNGQSIVLSSGAYVASVGDVDMKMKFGGLKSLLAKEGAFFLECEGNGDLWFNSYGGVHAVQVNGSFMVDNGHLVGFEGNLDYKIKSVGGGAMGFLASGEGLVCEFSGQGTVYIQSRNLGALVDWLTPKLPA